MNQLRAVLKSIESVENLNLLTFICGSQEMTVLSLALNTNLKIGAELMLSMKATDIALAKMAKGELSHENQLKAKVIKIKNGQILSSVQIEVEGSILSSLISKKSLIKMNLQEKDTVLMLVKGTEVSLYNA